METRGSPGAGFGNFRLPRDLIWNPEGHPGLALEPRGSPGTGFGRLRTRRAGEPRPYLKGAGRLV